MPTPNTTNKANTEAMNRFRLRLSRRCNASLRTALTTPRMGRSVTVRSVAASKNTGRTCVIKKAMPKPLASPASRDSGINNRRLGATGLGSARGGSITRKSAKPEELSSSPLKVMDSRRLTKSS